MFKYFDICAQTVLNLQEIDPLWRHLLKFGCYSSTNAVSDKLNLLFCVYVWCSSLIGDSQGTTAGSTWDHQTAYPQGSPCTPWRTLACCDVSRTAALPTTPAHRRRVERHLFSLVSFREMRWDDWAGQGKDLKWPLTRSSSDSRLVMWSALRFILLGWLRCLNKKWSCRAPIWGEEDIRWGWIFYRKWHNTSYPVAESLSWRSRKIIMCNKKL